MSGKKDAINDKENKPRLSLIPSEALLEMGKALTHGETRYGTHNFKEGIKISYLLDAALRHILQFNEGEDVDVQSGANHLGNAMANCAIALHMLQNKPSFDDRYKKDNMVAVIDPYDKMNTKDTSWVVTVSDMIFLTKGNIVRRADGSALNISADGTFPVKKGDVVYEN